MPVMVGVKEYAEKHFVSGAAVMYSIKSGKLNGIRKGRLWKLDESQPYPGETHEEGMLTASEYARKHGITVSAVSRRISRGKLEAVKQPNGRVLIRESAKFRGREIPKEGYLTVKEYAGKYGVNVSSVRAKITKGGMSNAVKKGNVWLIPDNAPCLIRPHGIPEGKLTSEEYAKKHGLKRQAILKRIKKGDIEAEKWHDIWLIDEDQPFLKYQRGSSKMLKRAMERKVAE